MKARCLILVTILCTISINALAQGLPTFWFGGGTIVGTVPTDPNITVVPVAVIPVALNITQGGVLYSFDPTQTDSGCLPASSTALSLFSNSPFFGAMNISFNGVSEGVTQYLDAFQRAELAYVVPNHHTYLSAQTYPTLPISLSVPAGGDPSVAIVQDVLAQCGNPGGTVNPQAKHATVAQKIIDDNVRSYISAHGIQPSQLAFFLFYNTRFRGDGTSCCYVGYHGMLDGIISLPGHTYAVAEFQGGNAFPSILDVSPISHELAEWANDPSGQNPVPAWGNIGQVNGCQYNLEVGDPLTGTFAPSLTLNGFTYHFQELAFLSWFVGDHPSQGAGGKYSSNGTFTGYAQPCPPGGTF
jgi:hypothetical protein